MKKFLVKFLVGILFVSGLIGGGSMVSAFQSSELGSYTLIVPKINDDHSTFKTKESASQYATNKVNYIEEGRNLVSWVENAFDRNVSDKVTYNTTGYKNMYMSNASSKVGHSYCLNVSTAINTFSTTTTTGKWAPSHFTYFDL